MSSKPFDATLKDLTEGYAADWARLLGQLPVTRAEVIDADVSTVTASGDKALKVQSEVGGEAFEWVLHLEPQSAHKLGVPGRVWWYNSVYHRRTGLPVRSVLLLLRPQANASDITGVWALRFPNEPEPYSWFRYSVVRAWELNVEQLLAGGVGTLPLAPLTDAAAPALQSVLSRIDARLRAEVPPEEADQVRAATGVLMGLRYPPDLVRVVLKGVSAMWEEVLKDSSVYQEAVHRGEKLGEERGLKLGEERGLKLGEERGLRAGEVRGAREMLLALGTERFGPPDAATRAALEALSDLPRLRELGKRVLTASGWQELLG